jgi:hypothetical protein
MVVGKNSTPRRRSRQSRLRTGLLTSRLTSFSSFRFSSRACYSRRKRDAVSARRAQKAARRVSEAITGSGYSVWSRGLRLSNVSEESPCPACQTPKAVGRGRLSESTHSRFRWHTGPPFHRNTVSTVAPALDNREVNLWKHRSSYMSRECGEAVKLGWRPGTSSTGRSSSNRASTDGSRYRPKTYRS